MNRLVILPIVLANILFSQTNISGQPTSTAGADASTVSNLVYWIKMQPVSNEDHTNKISAMKAAAREKHPDPQIVEALLDNLLYYTPGLHASPMHEPKFGWRPAWDAVIDIGEPVIPSILERIKHGDDELPKDYKGRTNSPPSRFITNSSGHVLTQTELLKPEEYAVLFKVHLLSGLLRKIAGPRTSAVLREEIEKTSNGKDHLEESLKFVQSLPR